MKKFISLILALSLIVSCTIAVAYEDIDEAKYRLEPFSLLDMENPDRPGTRAIAVKALIRLIAGDINMPLDWAYFTDVPKDHEAAKEIYYAKSLGYVSGTSEATFEPDAPITLIQFLKIAVCVLGYREAAEMAGGWQQGYMSLATKVGILNSTDLSGNQYLTVGDIILLINNMLDCHIAENITSPDKYEVMKTTLFEEMIKYGDFGEMTGIVEAIGTYSTKDNLECGEDQIVLSGTLMQYRVTDPLSLLGKKITVIYKDGTLTKSPVIVSVLMEEGTELVIDSKDILSMTSTELKYQQDAKKEKILKYESDTAKKTLIYNGTVDSDFTKLTTIPPMGKIRLVDIDNDNDYDLIFIDSYESFIVDRKSEINTTLYLKNGKTFDGKNGIWFDYEDHDKIYTIIGSDGAQVEFADIPIGSVVSVYADEAIDRVRVIVAESSVKGTVKGTDTSDEKLLIDDVWYDVYTPDKAALLGYNIGQTGTFLINHEGCIVGTMEPLGADGVYAWVEAFNPSTGFTPAKLRLIPSGTAQRKVKINKTTGAETVTYNYVNGSPVELEFAKNVNMTLTDGSKLRVGASELNSTYSSNFSYALIYYKTNSEGKISTATLYEVGRYEKVNSESNYNYNAKLNSYAKNKFFTPFFVKEQTQLILVPTKVNPALEDYAVEVTLSTNNGTAIKPFNIDDETQVAEAAVVFNSGMDAKDVTVNADEEIAIVGSVTVCLDENGETYYKLKALKDDKVENSIMYKGSIGEAVIRNLRCGDLVRYTTKSGGIIGGIELIAELSLLGDSYGFVNVDSPGGYAHAVVRRIELNRLHEDANIMVDKLFVTTNTSDTTGDELTAGSYEKYYYLDLDNMPTVYSYNRRTGEIQLASTEEINDYERAGDGATKVYLRVDSGVVKCIVILKD